MKAPWKTLTLAAAAVAALSAAPRPAEAALVLLGQGEIGGTGLGTVNTVLTLQRRGGATTETGSVSWNGTADVRTGDAQTGASQTQTRTLGAIGADEANELRIVFNASEPAGGSINLNSLVLTLYGSNGTSLFTQSLAAGITFTNTNTGTGNSGFIFGLDAAGIAAAGTAFSDPLTRIGLSASLSDAQGGQETFYAIAIPNPVVPPPPPPVGVPVPGAMALFGLGLLGLTGLRRRG
ncbi:PEP-CTERM sorting domain-containing protein [Roseococcus sp. DSY-14]|uniref:PEP-CTERM sorting domain-containing protein n=1 Tax=Roseococcus sp. DSY-14 TaxID=3369650 RepID=UPI00387AB7D2